MSTRSDRPARARAASGGPPATVLAGAVVSALCLLPPAVAGAEIYRTTAADGTVEFTDRPAPDATLVEPPPLNVVGTDGPSGPSARGLPGAVDARSAEGERFDGEPVDRIAVDAETRSPSRLAPLEPRSDDAFPTPLPDAPPTPSSEPATDERDAMADVPIERVVIASPPPDATLVDPVGALLVEVGTAPGSLAATTLVAEALVDGEVVASGTSSIAVPPLERGDHSLSVRLVDPDGRVVAESGTQTLYVRRSFVRSASAGGS